MSQPLFGQHNIRETAKQAVLSALEGVDVTTKPTLNLYWKAIKEAQAGITEALLQACAGNQTVAGEVGGYNRATIRRIIKDHDL